MRAVLMLALAALLLTPTLGEACPACRPRVQAAIHTPDYAANVALLLLPVAILLVLGVGLYWADRLWPRPVARPVAPAGTP
jgi:hypothetical protein